VDENEKLFFSINNDAHTIVEHKAVLQIIKTVKSVGKEREMQNKIYCE
jgi:hypothetical protein